MAKMRFVQLPLMSAGRASRQLAHLLSRRGDVSQTPLDRLVAHIPARLQLLHLVPLLPQLQTTSGAPGMTASFYPAFMEWHDFADLWVDRIYEGYYEEPVHV